MSKKEFVESNLEMWNEWAKIHEKSKFYDIPGFLSGKSSLKCIELEEVGKVEGKKLLHLMCHIGLDTLSWARKGADVTGVDFSSSAVKIAQDTAQKAGLSARFIESNLYDVPKVLPDESFDIVFMSYGVLPWLSNLKLWGKIVSQLLAPGGTFHLVEFHPVFDMLQPDGQFVTLPYFNSGSPVCFTKNQGTYAEPDAPYEHDSYEWFHPLSEVITSLCNAGLKIEFLHEFPYSTYPVNGGFIEIDDGKWAFEGDESEPEVPILYSIKATKL